MKALTLWRPWPFAIFHSPPEYAKRVENRSWKPPRWLIGERIAIHAGATFDNDGADFIGERLDDLGLLAAMKKAPGHKARVRAEGIIGTAIVAGCCHVDGGLVSGDWPVSARSSVDIFEQTIRAWLFGPYGWLFDDVRALPEPIPCKGQRGLWDVPEELLGRLAA